ncbi:hypothetical protein HYS47_02845 [Candidatus Woesearchaeota archaeon]|nr:hypothetical protein [Candidatus Woesearchaeota archaeon]
MKLVLKELGILSAAKMSMVITGLFGIIIGVLYGLILFAMMLANGSVGLAIGVGLLALIGFPILYAGFGFVFGALYAWLYNVFAAKMGGIEMTFEK